MHEHVLIDGALESGVAVPLTLERLYGLIDACTKHGAAGDWLCDHIDPKDRREGEQRDDAPQCRWGAAHELSLEIVM